MAQPLRNIESPNQPFSFRELPVIAIPKGQPVYQSYKALHVGYVVLPLIAGIDKFTNVLTVWPRYLAGVIPNTLGVSPQTFMHGVGVIEIVAAIGMIFKPRIFGYIVSGWLGGIILNLLIKGEYYDVALRDLGLAIGAAALARMSSHFEKGSVARYRT